MVTGKVFLSSSGEEISHRGRVNKVPRKGKNLRARQIHGEYLRRMKCGFRRFADGNHAFFSIAGFVTFIPTRRHKLASRRDASATLHCFSLRESAATSNEHHVATPADAAVPTALYLYFSPTSIGTIPLILRLTLL